MTQSWKHFSSLKKQKRRGHATTQEQHTKCGWTTGCICEGGGGVVEKIPMSQMMNRLPAALKFRFYLAVVGILEGLLAGE